MLLCAAVWLTCSFWEEKVISRIVNMRRDVMVGTVARMWDLLPFEGGVMNEL